MRSKQSGFTLIEIAIVLVIIGLLLGGVLKGQELINSAKVKNMATDFRNIPLFIYGYQDKFKALPGDDINATGRGFASATANGNGNGVINGNWNSDTVADESWIFWQHSRLAGLASGPTSWAAAAFADPYVPKNADGGRIGIESGVSGFIGALAAPVVPALTGSYVLCSDGILGKFAAQLDTTMDDGNTQTGSMRVVNGLTSATPHVRGQGALANATIVPDQSYSVCMAL